MMRRKRFLEVDWQARCKRAGVGEARHAGSPRSKLGVLKEAADKRAEQRLKSVSSAAA